MTLRKRILVKHELRMKRIVAKLGENTRITTRGGQLSTFDEHIYLPIGIVAM